ncbi:MAG: hypothetical protein ACK5ME_09350 [Parahaliea sp.]
MSKMQTFSFDPSSFTKATMMRVSGELFVLTGIIAFFLSSLSDGIPLWVKNTIVLAFTAYIFLGMYFYYRSRKEMLDFHLVLTGNGIIFPHNETIKEVLYSDLRLVEIQRSGDETKAIKMKSVFGVSITLRGYKSMNELAEELSLVLKKI